MNFIIDKNNNITIAYSNLLLVIAVDKGYSNVEELKASHIIHEISYGFNLDGTIDENGALTGGTDYTVYNVDKEGIKTEWDGFIAQGYLPTELNYDPDTKILSVNSVLRIANIKLKKIGEVKAVAYNKIIAIIPTWKQRNLTARAVQLSRKESAGKATAEEVLELDSIENIWVTEVVPIRKASNTIETEIEALKTEKDIKEFNISENINWPVGE